MGNERCGWGGVRAWGSRERRAERDALEGEMKYRLQRMHCAPHNIVRRHEQRRLRPAPALLLLALPTGEPECTTEREAEGGHHGAGGGSAIEYEGDSGEKARASWWCESTVANLRISRREEDADSGAHRSSQDPVQLSRLSFTDEGKQDSRGKHLDLRFLHWRHPQNNLPVVARGRGHDQMGGARDAMGSVGASRTGTESATGTVVLFWVRHYTRNENPISVNIAVKQRSSDTE
ncbi:hypothetical protein FB451DRAFT_1193914 [Mycena latifolia]|nr:hypothetical protein FB451DRAFT_1193914 [Mycena latifolia]